MINVLTKLSNPGFTIESESPELIKKHLEMYVCSKCLKTRSKYLNSLEDVTIDDVSAHMLPDNYDKLNNVQQIKELIRTSCGSKFEFQVFNTYEEYVKELL